MRERVERANGLAVQGARRQRDNRHGDRHEVESCSARESVPLIEMRDENLLRSRSFFLVSPLHSSDSFIYEIISSL